MNLTHHAVEVNSSFSCDCERFEEKIHQESLALSNTAPQINAGDQWSRFSKKQKFQEAVAMRVSVDQAILQLEKLFYDPSLRFVRDESFSGRVRGNNVQSVNESGNDSCLTIISARGYLAFAMAASTP